MRARGEMTWRRFGHSRSMLATVALAALGMSGWPAALRLDQPPAGTIEGRVAFEGSPPAPTPVEGGSQPVLYVGGSGGLRYAVVFLPDAQASGTLVTGAATMNQRNFIFEPQVLAVRAGQIVRFTNDDPANHNVRAQDADPANTFNIITASGSVGPNTHRMASTGNQPLELSCDIHPWMIAWIYAFDHDRFAITNADGSFRIANVPAGHYRVAVRQPAGGLTRDLSADVRAGEATRLEVRFTPADLDMPSR